MRNCFALLGFINRGDFNLFLIAHCFRKNGFETQCPACPSLNPGWMQSVQHSAVEKKKQKEVEGCTWWLPNGFLHGTKRKSRLHFICYISRLIMFQIFWRYISCFDFFRQISIYLCPKLHKFLSELVWGLSKLADLWDKKRDNWPNYLKPLMTSNSRSHSCQASPRFTKFPTNTTTNDHKHLRVWPEGRS